MLARIATLGLRAPRRMLGVTALLLVAAAVFGSQVADRLAAGGFTDPHAPSTVANTQLTERFHAGDPNLVFLVEAPGGADSPSARTEGTRLVGALRDQPYASDVSSYWTAPPNLAAGLRGTDGRAALVTATVAGNDDQTPKRAAAITSAVLAHRTPGVTVTAGGVALTYQQATDQITHDLGIAEAVAVPLTALVLIWVFGSLVAALLPLSLGLFAIGGALAILRGLTMITQVSIYGLNLITALGLALAIDYSLFVVSRYREEIQAGTTHPDAVRRTMRTAGRTVLFSALTVGLSLTALLVFPVYFLRSFAYAGVAVVVMAAAATLLVLPALLALLGPRINALDVRTLLRHRAPRDPTPHQPTPRRRTTGVPAVERGFWYRTAAVVMRRPLPAGLAVLIVLLLLATPFLGVRFGYPDDRVLPSSASTRQVGDALRDGFTPNPTGTITIVLPNTPAEPATTGGYAGALSRVDGVTSVTSAAGTYAAGQRIAPPVGPSMTTGTSSYLVLRTGPDPMSDQGRRLLSTVESMPAPGPTLVTGQAAQNADSVHALAARLPLAVALIAIATFAVLFLFTGSVVLPLKALVLNTLSLSATFGAMVWIFQRGHLANLFGATVTGYLVATMPLLMFCLSFGISMDYEVFLLSRIREEWLASGDNVRAVAMGLGRTGRIVTAAALLMAIVFAALATGQVSFIKLFGTGLTLAVLMDATLVRGVLVPAFMRVAGRWNWWAPQPVARWHARHGWTESGTDRVADRTPGRSVVNTG